MVEWGWVTGIESLPDRFGSAPPPPGLNFVEQVKLVDRVKLVEHVKLAGSLLVARTGWQMK